MMETLWQDIRFGIRMALGAQTVHVMSQMLGEGLRLVGVGLAIGVGAAFVLTHFLQSLLFGVEPYDPVTFASIAGVLLAAGALACWIPARRAARVDPMVALRYE